MTQINSAPKIRRLHAPPTLPLPPESILTCLEQRLPGRPSPRWSHVTAGVEPWKAAFVSPPLCFWEETRELLKVAHTEINLAPVFFSSSSQMSLTPAPTHPPTLATLTEKQPKVCFYQSLSLSLSLSKLSFVARSFQTSLSVAPSGMHVSCMHVSIPKLLL